MDLAEAKAAAQKAKPLLQARNDALDFLYASEKIAEEHNDKKLWGKASDTDYDNFVTAIRSLEEALLGKRDAFGIKIKDPVPLEEMPAMKEAFEEKLLELPYTLRDHIRNSIKGGREERLEKSIEVYENQLLRGKTETPKAPKVYTPTPKETPTPYKKTEEPKGTPVKDTTNWPTPKEEEGTKRLPARGDEDAWRKLAPGVSELVRLPNGRGSKIGEDTIDAVLDLLDNGWPEEKFLEEAHKTLSMPYYDSEGLEKKIDELKEVVKSQTGSKKDKLAKELFRLEERHNNITKLDGNLKFLYEHWMPMKNQSNLVKQVSENYKLILGDKQVTLESTWLTASLKFTSSREACKKFIELTTDQDVEAAFSVAALINLEKESAALESIIKEDTKGPSAEEEKIMVDALVDWLKSSNAQGSEEDIEKKTADYLASKAPQYAQENLDRVARKVFAEWTASKPVPGEVGQEGKAGMGVANNEGTGVFVEPSRGNTNVQNGAPTGDQRGNVRKEAMTPPNPMTVTASDLGISLRTEAVGELKTSSSLDLFATVKCLMCDNMLREGSSEYRTFKGEICNDHKLTDIPIALMKEAAAEDPYCYSCNKALSQEEVKDHEGKGHSVGVSPKVKAEASLQILSFIVHMPGHKNAQGEEAPWVIKSHETGKILSSHTSHAKAKEHLQQMHMFKSMGKEASMEAGDSAVLNKQVGVLPEGTEVDVTSCSDTEVTFTAGNILGVTKLANLDKSTISKEAGKGEEKYPWDNEGLEFKFCLGDRVRVGSVELNGESWKGEEGIIREKVVLATSGDAERFYLVELDCGGNETLPEESLSKAGKRAEAALNHDELTKVALIKPNIDAVQDFLKSYEHPPTVVTTTDIEEWMSDEKQNYQYSKKDLKEFIKYLQSAHVEVRVPSKKEVPNILPGEAGTEEEAPEKSEGFEPAPELKKEAIKYRYVSPDGKSTTEKDVDQDMGPEFETVDPQAQQGPKMKWTKANMEVCAKCSGMGSLPCSCMDDELWLSKSCEKCQDEGSTPCLACA